MCFPHIEVRIGGYRHFTLIESFHLELRIDPERDNLIEDLEEHVHNNEYEDDIRQRPDHLRGKL